MNETKLNRLVEYDLQRHTHLEVKHHSYMRSIEDDIFDAIIAE